MKKFSLILAFFLISNSLFCQWTSSSVTGASGVQKIVAKGGNLFACTYTIGNAAGVVKSTDNGQTWIAVNNGLPNLEINCLVVLGNAIYAGADYASSSQPGGVYKSVDDGASWVNTSTGLVTNDRKVVALVTDGTSLFLSCLAEKVYKSDDGGQTWYSFHQGLTSFASASSAEGLFVFNGNIYLAEGATLGGRVWRRSVSGGANWVSVNTGGTGSDNEVRSFASLNNALYCSSNSGIYKTTNNGTNWSRVYSDPSRTILASGNYLFASYSNSSSSGFIKSSDAGNTWIQKNEGFSGNPTIISMLVNNGYVLLGAIGNKIYRRPFDQVPVENITTAIPRIYSLSQNFPNPFNPETNIKFVIPKSEFVTIKVYDIVGKEVKELVNQNMTAGEYKVGFDGTGVESGVYFYKINAGEFTQTRKMILIK